MQSLVQQLQADAVDRTISVSDLLRKAKIVAVKLDLAELLDWINKELDGYDDIPYDSIPNYRQLSGKPEGFNPYRGWIPIQFKSGEVERFYSRLPVRNPAGTIEHMLSANLSKDGVLLFTYTAEMRESILEGTGHKDLLGDVAIPLSYAELSGIIDAVRNIILDWSLKLERSGVLGKGLTFAENEKRAAAPVTHQFFTQNIGVVGNVTDAAQVTNVQSAGIADVDREKLTDLVRQIRGAAHLIPEADRDGLIKQAETLDAELQRPDANSSGIQRALQSIRSICEGATGNVVAQGVLRLLEAL